MKMKKKEKRRIDKNLKRNKFGQRSGLTKESTVANKNLHD